MLCPAHMLASAQPFQHSRPSNHVAPASCRRLFAAEVAEVPNSSFLRGNAGRHLLAIHDLDPSNAHTCLDLQAVSTFYAASLRDGSPNPNASTGAGRRPMAYLCSAIFLRKIRS